MRDHDFEGVELQDDGYVLVCTCGWRSQPAWSAGTVGDEWDRHRRVVRTEAS